MALGDLPGCRNTEETGQGFSVPLLTFSLCSQAPLTMASLSSQWFCFFQLQELHVQHLLRLEPSFMHTHTHKVHTDTCTRRHTCVHTSIPLVGRALLLKLSSSLPPWPSLSPSPSRNGQNCSHVSVSVIISHLPVPLACKAFEDRDHVLMGTCPNDQTSQYMQGMSPTSL
jgi:hypothetical protein